MPVVPASSLLLTRYGLERGPPPLNPFTAGSAAYRVQRSTKPQRARRVPGGAVRWLPWCNMQHGMLRRAIRRQRKLQHARARARALTQEHTHARTTRTRTHTHARANTHSPARAHTRAHAHARTRTKFAHARAHFLMCAHRHTDTQTHRNRSTRTRARRKPWRSCAQGCAATLRADESRGRCKRRRMRAEVGANVGGSEQKPDVDAG
jgi:hypothetical protein